MKYLVLLMADGDVPPWGTLDERQQGELLERFGTFDAACTARDGVEILAGEALPGPDVMTTVRTRSGEQVVTDGPYAEAVEGLGGFYLMEAPDLDVVLELLRELPPYDMQVSPTGMDTSGLESS